MSEIVTCSCGQQLDLSDFAPGDEVQCPQCQKIITVPPAAAEPDPPMAMAVALPDDEEDEVAPAAGAANKFVHRRKMAEKRAAAQASGALQRVLLWPALVFALLAFGVGGLGIYLMTMPPKFELVSENGIERIFTYVPESTLRQQEIEARIEASGGGDDEAAVAKALAEIVDSGKFERVEVQPDIYPGDQYLSPDSIVAGQESPFKLQGRDVTFKGEGNYELQLEENGDIVYVIRRGLHFYRLEDGKPGERLDLPLMGAIHNGGYERVIFEDENFYSRESDGSRGALVNVEWYIVDDKGVQQNHRMSAGQFRESRFMGLRPKQVANLFAISGFAIGLLLVAMAGLMFYGSYMSPAAKQRAAQQRAFAEEQQKKQAAAKPQSEEPASKA